MSKKKSSNKADKQVAILNLTTAVIELVTALTLLIIALRSG